MSLPNDTCAAATPITSFPYSDSFDPSLAGNSPSTPDDVCGSGNSYNSVWFSFVWPATPRVEITWTDGGTSNSIVTLLSGVCGSLAYFDCLSGGGSAAFYSGTPGEVYHLLFTDYVEGSVPNISFTLQLPEPEGDVCIDIVCEAPPPPPAVGCIIDLDAAVPPPGAGSGCAVGSL